MSTSKSQVKRRTSNVTNLMTISRKFGSRKVQRLTEAGSLRAVRPTNLIFNTNKLHKRSTSKDPFSFLFVCLFVCLFFCALIQPRPQGFSLKNWVLPHPFFKGKALGTRLALILFLPWVSHRVTFLGCRLLITVHSLLFTRN